MRTVPVRWSVLFLEICFLMLVIIPGGQSMATMCQAVGKPDTYNVFHGTIASMPVSSVTIHEFDATASKFFIRCLSWTETVGIDAAQQSTAQACPRGIPQLCRREVPSSSIPDPPWECNALSMYTTPSGNELQSVSIGTVDGPASNFRLSWTYTGVTGVVGTCFPRQVVVSVVTEVYTKRTGSLALFILFIIFFVMFLLVGACYLCLVFRRWSSGKLGGSSSTLPGPGIELPKQPLGRYQWSQGDGNPQLAGIPANRITRNPIPDTTNHARVPYTDNPIKSALADGQPSVVPRPVLRSFDQYRDVDVDQDSDEEGDENQEEVEEEDVYVCTECGMDVEDRRTTPQICPVSKKRHY